MEAMKQWYSVWHHKDGYGIGKANVIKETKHFVTIKSDGYLHGNYRTSKIQKHGFYTDNLDTAKDFLKSKYQAIIFEAQDEINFIENMEAEETMHL